MGSASRFGAERARPWLRVGLGIVVWACIACASTTQYTTGMVSSVTTSGPLTLRLEAPAIVAGGQPVPLRLVLTNTSDSTVRIGVPDQKFYRTDFKIMQGSRTVWHKLRHRSCACAEMTGPLSPNSSVTFVDFWPQRSNHHWPIAPGKYTVKAIVFEASFGNTPGGIESAPVDIRVR